MSKKNMSDLIDFKSSEIIEFSIGENYVLNLTVTLKNKELIQCKVINLMQFRYQKIKKFDSFELLDSSLYLNEFIDSYYVKKMSAHPFKHFKLMANNIVPVLEFIAESVEIIEGN